MLLKNIHRVGNRFVFSETILLVFMMSATFLQSSCAQADVMKWEAQTFLAGLPEGLQNSQMEAVRKATGGDTSELMAVRNSRNAASKLPEGVIARDIGDKYRLYLPTVPNSNRLPVLIYLHGGGWCFGSINSCARFCAELSRAARIAVLAVDYPLAPEHPYPAALNACTEAVMFVNGNAEEYEFDTGRVSVGGDSAGGNLALATALNLVFAKQIIAGRGEELPSINSLVLFYPVTKALADGSDSWQAYATGYGLDAGLMEAFNKAYIGVNDARLPLISPGLAADEHLKQLPRTLIVNATYDILLSQGTEMAQRLDTLGVEVQHMVLPNTVHLFITVQGQPTAFHESVRMTAEFLGKSN